ncbi:MAG: hypothetical protein ACXACI_13915 [Candidatus Hodarchaeales archaeon]
MLRKNIKEFLRKMGLLDEDISDETIDQMVRQLLQILDTPDLHQLQNALNIKTGAVLHQFVLKNQAEVRSKLLDQLRIQGEQRPTVPLKLKYTRTCLYLDEDGQSCSIAKKTCPYSKEIQNCDIVQASLDPDLEPWK